MWRRLLMGVMVLAAVTLGACAQDAAHAQDAAPEVAPDAPTAPAEKPAANTGSDKSNDAKEGDEKKPASFPGIRLNLQEKYVDLEAAVILREGKWLELLACMPGSREHESILIVPALPSHIHAALLMIGLTPGHPLRVTREGEELKVTAPVGPEVRVSVHFIQDGKRVSLPANQWIRNQKTGEMFEGDVWLFTGSVFHLIEEQKVYAADVEGSIISIVNFGDDVLTRPTLATNMSDNAEWAANTEKIPPVGTPVIVRLQPVVKQPAEKAAEKAEADDSPTDKNR